LTCPINFDIEEGVRTYLIKIFTRPLQTKFYMDSETEINSVEELHKKLIDFLGKNKLEWEENLLKYSKDNFYITYEEVERDKQHNVTLRQEATT
jgi:hypothetical protein